MEAKSRQTEVIVVTSGKGGVGKSTTAANVGIGLAKRGKKVILIDTDTGQKCLDAILDLESRVVYNLVEWITGECDDVSKLLVRDKRMDSLFLISTSQTKDKKDVKPEDMVRLVNELIAKEEPDYIILDCPAGIEEGFKTAVAPANHVILVTNPEVTAVRGCDRVIGKLRAEAKTTGRQLKMHLVINKIDRVQVTRGELLDIGDVLDVLGVELLGVAPQDMRVSAATNEGKPIIYDSGSPAGTEFDNIARRLLGDVIPLPKTYAETAWLRRVLMKLGILRSSAA